MIDVEEIRKQIHRLPELSGEEFKTAEFIEGVLDKLGIPNERMAGTGVVGLIDNGKAKTIILRAELDALPIQEETGLEFSSEVAGKMHACGHDVHIAILLGTAQELMKKRDKLQCNVKLVFQPAEEAEGGARRMIDEGVAEDVDCALAFHVWPEWEYGVVGLRDGALMATCDEFEIEVRGKGGHVAMRDSKVNPILIAGEVVARINAECIMGNIGMGERFVFDVCNIQGGCGVNNVVPDTCIISGSMRVLSLEARDEIIAKIEEILKGFDATLSSKILWDYPPMVNDSEVTAKVNEVAGKHAEIKKLEKPYFTAEDFACFGEAGVPSCLILLGCGGSELHRNDFVADERTIDLGIKIWSDFVEGFH
jgi:amidohydrolase